MFRLTNLVAINILPLLASVGALRYSSGCGKALPLGMKQGGTGSSNSVHFTTSAGVKRHYLLHLPEVYTPTKAHGLIFSFHGRGESGAEQERLSQFSNPSFNPGHLAVYPDGVDAEWQGDPDAHTDDVAFVLELLANLSSQYCVDEDRVFAAGKSNGGGFATNVLACDPVASTKIAAFAGVAGAYYQGTSDAGCDAATVPIACAPGRKPVPIFETHGSADAVISYYGGPRRDRCLPTIPHFVTAWAERDGLGSSNVSTELYGGDVVKYEFGKNAGLQGIVTHYWVHGLGHAWPSTKPNDDGSGTYFNATPLIMDFFDKHTLATSVPSTSMGRGGETSSTGTTARLTSTTASKSAASPSSTAGSATSPVCPGANGTRYTTTSGCGFGILCGWDTTSPYFDVRYELGSFGKCISTCDEDSSCGHVTYNGACYLKKAAEGYVQKRPDVDRVAIKLT